MWILMVIVLILVFRYSDNFLTESMGDMAVLGLITFPLVVMLEWVVDGFTKAAQKLFKKSEQHIEDGEDDV